MTAEDKELLMRDLCARLHYGVKVTTTNPAIELGVVSGISIGNKISVRTKHADIVFDCTEVKPFLRHISSMTEEEKGEYQAFFNYNGIEYPEEYVNWLDSKMFAHRDIKGKDMFELGLAIKAPEGMYN